MIQKFEFRETEISGVLEIISFNNDDLRGSFTKDYSREIFAENGIGHELAEVFYTTNHKGVLRGMHFQREHQQPKLVRCISGHIYDVIVDLRSESPTFKRWRGFDLTGEKCNELLVPGGCAHGYLALETSIVAYKCAEKFYPEFDSGIVWNDPDISIDWRLEKIGGEDKLIISEKDKKMQSFKEFTSRYGGLK